MMGSLGWRLFFAAMLLSGLFAALVPEGETVSESWQAEVAMAEEVPYLIGTNKTVLVEDPAFKSCAVSGDFAMIDHNAVEVATSTFDMTKVAEFHGLHTDKNALAAKEKGVDGGFVYHLLCFSGGRLTPTT